MHIVQITVNFSRHERNIIKETFNINIWEKKFKPLGVNYTLGEKFKPKLSSYLFLTLYLFTESAYLECLLPSFISMESVGHEDSFEGMWPQWANRTNYGACVPR